MQLDVRPRLDDEREQALRRALECVRVAERARESAWQRAALAEAVERADGYAFSPRRTRGATRA